MTGSLYPSLGRYFKNLTERLWECLTGQKNFTRAEKKAISANIMAKELCKQVIDERELTDALTAYKGKFDEIYRRKEQCSA